MIRIMFPKIKMVPESYVIKTFGKQSIQKKITQGKPIHNIYYESKLHILYINSFLSREIAPLKIS